MDEGIAQPCNPSATWDSSARWLSGAKLLVTMMRYRVISGSVSATKSSKRKILEKVGCDKEAGDVMRLSVFAPSQFAGVRFGRRKSYTVLDLAGSAICALSGLNSEQPTSQPTIKRVCPGMRRYVNHPDCGT